MHPEDICKFSNNISYSSLKTHLEHISWHLIRAV